ncbi:hypothetical protein [Microbacterium halophytorum]|uniref:hypothetical protein n=1 Tax=Microbacterium halophytorum TaxID=2067568 RepID=UPI000CFC4516|nr:hypothetical protein [Microbacterium halophytorum]
MALRRILRRLNDPNSVAHGVVSTALMAALALIEPRRLSTGRRLAYRGAVAGLTAWTMWASLRPSRDTEGDELGFVGRAAITTGAAGAALGLAEAGEALDARLNDGLVRAGVRRPRLWLAAGEAALSFAAWWAARAADRASRDEEDSEEPAESIVEVPEGIRALASLLLSATDEHGAPQLREQLLSARLVSSDGGEFDVAFAQFDVDQDLPRAVPGNGAFPVIGRFRALGDRTFDVRLFVANGRLESVHIDEGGDWSAEEVEEWYEAGHDPDELETWPSPDEVELLIETAAGYRPLVR